MQALLTLHILNPAPFTSSLQLPPNPNPQATHLRWVCLRARSQQQLLHVVHHKRQRHRARVHGLIEAQSLLPNWPDLNPVPFTSGL